MNSFSSLLVKKMLKDIRKAYVFENFVLFMDHFVEYCLDDDEYEDLCKLAKKVWNETRNANG